MGRVIRAIASFPLVLMVYQGVSLLRWGLGDLAGCFSAGPRLVHALVVTAFGIGGVVQAYGSMAGIRGALRCTNVADDPQDLLKRCLRRACSAGWACCSPVCGRESALVVLRHSGRVGWRVISRLWSAS